MDYQDALNYLFRLGHETLTMKLGLENMLQLNQALADPIQAFQAIHIAGTNGKGSFCAMLAAICKAANIPTGLFTSPHLIDLTERFCFNLTAIDQQLCAKLITRVKDAVDRLIAAGTWTARPTFFEHVTAVAFEYFRECGVQLAIVEVGLGGRLDSTNILTPLLSVITHIDYDHQQYLGNTLAQIAREKAGIIKPQVPVLTFNQAAQAAIDVIVDVANQRQSPIVVLDRSKLEYHYNHDGYYRFSFNTTQHHYEDITIGLRGEHQVATAALAILAAEQLALVGWPIKKEHIIVGLANVQWPGRLEVLRYQGRNLLLDGAHNSQGIQVLCEFLDSWLLEKSFTKRVLIFAAMRDKEIASMAGKLFPYFDEVIFVEREEPRAATFELCNVPATDNISVIKGSEDALKEACERVDDHGVIVGAGSLHLVGELRKILQS